jgi:hypothetical protein
MILLTAYSQDSIRTYKNFVVVQQNGERFEGQDGVMTAKRFTGFLKNGTPFDISKNDIETLFVQTGSQSGKYALYGGLFGLAIGVVAYISWAADPMRNDNGPSPLVLTLASTACGALIGGIIGSSSSEWHVEPIVAFLPMHPNDFQNSVFAVRLSINL